MCGLAGALLIGAAKQQHQTDDAVHRMCDRMQSRGPDAVGYWSDPDLGLTLGHRRLSILDLEARANQPMISDDGRYVIVFNGEIYNFRELRRGLEHNGDVFRTQSDTEVLLKLYAEEGEAILTRLRGMFAFAIWDCETRSMFLARDPYGIKPLYLACSKAGWLFASQVKALLASGLVADEPDPVGQAGFWLLGSVPEPRTWFRKISALPAGHYAYLTEAGFQPSRSYWDIGGAWREEPESVPCDAEIHERVRSALKDSVRAHLIADVPVGVFLSGGIDSGSLAALIKEAGVMDLQGITIAFREFAGRPEDEVPMAARVAAQYGISHHVRIVTYEEFAADLPLILEAMDQPTVDGVNTWYASKAAAEIGLKAVISGVGGDELFQGYSTFRQLPALVWWWQAASRIPGFKPMSRLFMALRVRQTNNPRWHLVPSLAGSMAGAWFLRRGLFSPSELIGLMGEDLATEALEAIDPQDFVHAMTGVVARDPRLAVGQIESMTYLRNQLLRDSDWASMDHGLELRTPLVDAWLLRDLEPVLAAFHRFPGKRLLAEAPQRPLLEDAKKRRKTGFSTPINAWITANRITSGSRPRQSWARTVAEAFAETGRQSWET